MKRIFAIAALILLLTGCSAGQPTKETESVDTMLPKNKTYEILFIGNSYTFYNDMPTVYFETMAKSCGYDIRIHTVTKGAYTLEKFADAKDPYGGLVATALNGTTKFDYVILQEQSVRPAVSSEAFFNGVRALSEQIRAIGAQPVLYATWGRKEGSDTLEKYAMTSEDMTWKLAAAYETIGRELDIPVVHVGLAFRELRSKTALELYNDDKSHPSPTGSYLAAMSLFCRIFEADPSVITLKGPAGEEEAVLRQVVRQILQNPPVIPDSYK